jgi:hypothetical protein
LLAASSSPYRNTSPLDRVNHLKQHTAMNCSLARSVLNTPT